MSHKTAVWASHHARLQAATASQHLAIEAALGLEKISSSLPNYISALHCLYSVLQSTHMTFINVQFSTLNVNFGHIDLRRRWLARDLEVLKASPSPPGAPLTLSTEGHALGCLYVLEGSALGGRVIYKQVRARLGLGPDSGASYFHGLGGETARGWARFLDSLNVISPMSTIADEAEAGALATFAAFAEAVRRPQS